MTKEQISLPSLSPEIICSPESRCSSRSGWWTVKRRTPTPGLRFQVPMPSLGGAFLQQERRTYHCQERLYRTPKGVLRNKKINKKMLNMRLEKLESLNHLFMLL